MKTRLRRSAAVAMLALFGALIPAAKAFGEQRLYVLRVSLPTGERYETLSSVEPYTYASGIGATLRYSKDYRHITSPDVRIEIVESWIERREPLRKHWPTILRERGFHKDRNHRPARKSKRPAG